MEEENKNVEQPVVDNSTPVEPVQTPVTEAPVEPAPAPVEPVVQPEVAPAPVAEPAVAPATEEPKKKGKGGLIFLLLLLLVGGGFAGWYFCLGGDKVLSGQKDEPKQEEKEEKKEEEAKKDDDKKEEEKKEDTKKDDDKKEEEKTSEPKQIKEEDASKYDDLIKKLINKRGSNTSYSSDELSNQDVLYFGVEKGNLRSKDEFTVSELSELIKSSGLGDIEYTNETIKCFCGKDLFDYSADQNKYVKSANEHNHGGGSFISHKKFFVSGKLDETKGTLVINYKIIYGEQQGDLGHANKNLYLTAKDAYEETNGIYETTDTSAYGTEEDFNKAYEEFKDKVPVTTFYFEKGKNGNYTFKKVETK